MKMFEFKIYCLAFMLPLLLLASCGREERSDFQPVRLAADAVSDTASAAFKSLSGYQNVGNAGAIAVFGGLKETAVLSERLLTADIFDNIDAHKRPDGLPDFAGETVMPVFDMVNAPYTDYIGAMNENFIRETAVKGFLSMVSGNCASSAFDHGQSASKPRAKIVLLSSSVMSEYGCHDIEYIVSASGMHAGVLNPAESSLSRIFSRASQASNVGVWAASDVVSSGVYGNVFREIRAEYEDKHSDSYREWARSSEIICLSPDAGNSAEENVRRFFDAYISANCRVPLSGVVIDDFARASEVDSLNQALNGILLSETQESEIYKRLVIPGFRFVSPVETLTEDCYMWLRNHDRFTHLVAQPAMTGYMTVVSSEVQGASLDENGWLEPEFKYNRAAGSEIETFRFIPLSQSYFGGEDLEMMRRLSPETYKKLIYVY